MKNRKTFFMVLILILCFSFLTPGLTVSNEKNDKDKKNILHLSSAGNSVKPTWYRTWDFDQEWSEGVAVDSTGNIYLVGCVYNMSSMYKMLYDMVLVKYDSSGVQQWNRTWGGSGVDEGYGVAVDSSDNVYLAGSTSSFGEGSSDMVLMKYDGSGVQQWNCTWGGGSSDESYGVAVDSSDNVYLVGGTNSFGEGSRDMVLMKYDGSGVQQWYRTWGGSSFDEGYGVAVDSFDNVYLSGSTESFPGTGGESMFLVKYGVKKQPISSYDLLLVIIIIGAITAITAISLNKKYSKKFLPQISGL